MDAMISKLDVRGRNGTPFRVVYLPTDVPSENYPAEARVTGADQPRVEFYDRRYPHTPDGQFTGARYYADDILCRVDFGLALQGGIDAWTVDRDAMVIIRNWLRHTMAACRV